MNKKNLPTVNDLIMGTVAADIAQKHYKDLKAGTCTGILNEKIAAGLKAKRKELRKFRKQNCLRAPVWKVSKQTI